MYLVYLKERRYYVITRSLFLGTSRLLFLDCFVGLMITYLVLVFVQGAASQGVKPYETGLSAY